MAQLEISDANWKSLYKIGGVVAVILIIYSFVTMALLVVVGGQPETAAEGFAMLQENRIVGLLRLDILTLFIVPLYYVLFLSFYVALKRTHATYASLVAVLAFAGITLTLATPSALSLLSLSDKFAAATDEVQRGRLLAAGEAILASDVWHSTGAYIGAVLSEAAAVLVSVVMLRDKAFGKFTAYVGIVTHGLDLAHILLGLFFPEVGVILMMVAGPLYLVWFPLLARDLFRLGRSDSKLK